MTRYQRWIAATLTAVLIVAGAIFFFSAQPGQDSSDLSASLTVRLLQWFHPGYAGLAEAEKSALLEAWHTVVRKAAHFSEYVLLGACLTAFFHALHRAKPRWLKGLVALLICALYACTDEVHQMFVDSRGPAFTDVLIDTAGALAGIAAMALVLSLRRRVREPSLTAPDVHP